MSDAIRRNLALVHARIAAACARAGRDPRGVTLLCVVKQRPIADAHALVALGEHHLAENRVQEARERIPAFPPGPEWHFIGRLQTNKAKFLPPLFSWIHSIDRVDAAEAVSRAYASAGAKARVFLQANVSGEEAKAGAGAEEAAALVRAAAALPALRIEGLMTMAPYAEDPELARPVFRALRELRDRLERETDVPLPGLSMGMSGDFEAAIEEGATIVRVGSALFAD